MPSVIIVENGVRSVMIELSPLIRRNMSHDNLKQKIRELGHLLAYEEEAGHHLKNWYARKREHGYLLKKLYQLERKV